MIEEKVRALNGADKVLESAALLRSVCAVYRMVRKSLESMDGKPVNKALATKVGKDSTVLNTYFDKGHHSSILVWGYGVEYGKRLCLSLNPGSTFSFADFCKRYDYYLDMDEKADNLLSSLKGADRLVEDYLAAQQELLRAERALGDLAFYLLD